MAEVTTVFHERWHTGDHVGEARPVGRAFIRRGRFERGYEDWENHLQVRIPGSFETAPWQATWNPSEPYSQLPHLKSIKLDQSFDQRGVTVATIEIDNITYLEQLGVGIQGEPDVVLWRAINRGYLSPFRGYARPGRPAKTGEENFWFQKLNRNAQITVVEGYGDDELMPTFCGLIDNIDMDSQPDKIVITARGHGGKEGDQHLMGRVKDPHLRDPITIADWHNSERVEWVGGNPRSTPSKSGHPARFIVDDDPNTSWISESSDDPWRTKYVEIHLPHGFYESIYLDVAFPNMEVFIGMYATARNGHDTYLVNGNGHEPGWYDPHGEEVPGEDHGGWPYFRHIKRLHHSKGRHIKLKNIFRVGDDTVLRVAFRRLERTEHDKYRAGVTRLQAKRRHIKPPAKKYILVRDVADIVRIACRWMGFKNLSGIQQTGVRVKGKYVVNRSTTLTDLVVAACEQTGFVFYVREPNIDLDEDGHPEADHSLGKPIFRPNGVMQRRGHAAEIRDNNLLTGFQPKITEEPLASDIRVRGRRAPKRQGGRPLGGDRVRRITGHYRPPWSTRLAGIKSYEIINRYPLKNKSEVMMACFLIALQQALASVTGIVEIPGNPEFELDDHVSVIDTGTGFQSRLWIAQRTSEHTFGEDGKWVSSLGGALIDTPDLVAIRRDMRHFFKRLHSEPDGDESNLLGVAGAPEVHGYHERQGYKTNDSIYGYIESP